MDIKNRYNLIIMDDGGAVITMDHNTPFKEQCSPEHPYRPDWHKRYRYKVGSKVINPWGAVETIKEVIHHEDTESTNYLVEENGNCYLPRELNGIFVKSLSKEETERLINE